MTNAAADITYVAGAIVKWFPVVTGSDSGVKNYTKAEVWTTQRDSPRRARHSFAKQTTGPARKRHGRIGVEGARRIIGSELQGLPR